MECKYGTTPHNGTLYEVLDEYCPNEIRWACHKHFTVENIWRNKIKGQTLLIILEEK